MNSKNKKLLISWGAHTFEEVAIPLIIELSKDHDIVITTVDYYIPDDLLVKFEELLNSKTIKEYFIVPSFENIRIQYLYLRNNTQLLREYKFDIWLTGSEMQVNERYIQEFILPSSCKIVILWQGITYLLLSRIGSSKEGFLNNQTLVNDNSIISYVLKLIQNKIISKGGLKNVLLACPSIIKLRINWVWKLINRKISYGYSRIILPYFYFRKTFRYGVYDKQTQLGSGRADFLLLSDPVEVELHNKLLRPTKTLLVAHSSQGSCRCHKKSISARNIISPLSGIVGVDEISQDLLNKYLRDYKIVVVETQAECIHLRKHPRETGRWPYQLQDYLVENGINARVVTADKTLREVMCDYIGIVGFASCALRDARACCDMLFVVGFEAVSKFRYYEPKLVYGSGEGICWINEDASYDPKIFTRKKYISPVRTKPSDMIRQLLPLSNSSL